VRHRACLLAGYGRLAPPSQHPQHRFWRVQPGPGRPAMLGASPNPTAAEPPANITSFFSVAALRWGQISPLGKGWEEGDRSCRGPDLVLLRDGQRRGWQCPGARSVGRIWKLRLRTLEREKRKRRRGGEEKKKSLISHEQA